MSVLWELPLSLVMAYPPFWYGMVGVVVALSRELAGPVRDSGFVLGMDISAEREHDTSANGCAPGTSPGRVVVRVGLCGELGMAYAGAVQTVLIQLWVSGFPRVVLDFTELRFLGAAGGRVVAHAVGVYAEGGGSLTVTGPTRMTSRVLALCELAWLTPADTDAHPVDAVGPHSPRPTEDPTVPEPTVAEPRVNPRSGGRATGISPVMTGLRFPARRWELFAQAEFFRAAYCARPELNRLATHTYPPWR